MIPKGIAAGTPNAMEGAHVVPMTRAPFETARFAVQWSVEVLNDFENGDIDSRFCNQIPTVSTGTRANQTDPCESLKDLA